MNRRSDRKRAAALVVVALVASCGSPTGGRSASSSPPTASSTTSSTSATTSLTSTTTATPTSTTTAALASTSSTAASGVLLEPGPIGDPQCAGGVAANAVDTVDGGRRQLDVTDTFVCVEGPRMSLAMPLPPWSSPAVDSVTFLIDTRNEYGGAFVFALPDGLAPPARARTADGRIVPSVISPNGHILAIYDPEALQGPVITRFDLLAADDTVLANVAAVYPRFTSDGAGNTLPTLPADDAALPAIIAASLTGAQPPGYLGPLVTPSEGLCIGEGIVAALGATRVRELDIGALSGPALWLGFGATADEANAVVDVLQRCALHWKRFSFVYATAGTAEMSEASAQCVEREITDDQARAFLVKERSGYRTIDHVLPIEAAVDRCVTPAERARIDWD